MASRRRGWCRSYTRDRRTSSYRFFCASLSSTIDTISPAELVLKMPNPFKTLEIADLQAARQASKDKQWQGFVDQSSVLGSATVLRQQPKRRKQNMALLRASAANWRNPSSTWKGFAQAAQRIAP